MADSGCSPNEPEPLIVDALLVRARFEKQNHFEMEHARSVHVLHVFGFVNWLFVCRLPL